MSYKNGLNDKVGAAFKQPKSSSMYRKGNSEAYDAIASKLVRGNETAAAIRDNGIPVSGMQDPYIRGTLNQSLTRIRDSNNILQILPDIKLGIEIIIGGILSPKDLMNTALTFSSNSDIFSDKAGALINKIENYFTTSYKLKDDLPKMLWDILGKTGSYPLAVLPETSVDWMINSNTRITMEGLTQSLYTQDGNIQHIGHIANKRNKEDKELNPFEILKSISTEGFGLTQSREGNFDSSLGEECLLLNITDNFDVLKIPSVQRKVSAQHSNTIISERRKSIEKHYKGKTVSYSSEALVQVNNIEANRTEKEIKELEKLYPQRQFTSQPILRVKPRSALEKPNFGHPLVIKLPTESVIPIYSPNDPEDHLGYLVALDNTGIPLRLAELDNLYRDISSSSNAASGNSAASWALQQVVNQSQPDMRQNQANMSTLQALERAAPIYRQMIETETLDRIARGSLGTGIAMGHNDNIWLMMLARACAGKHTQLLYIPETLLAYLTVDYDEFGENASINNRFCVSICATNKR